MNTTYKDRYIAKVNQLEKTINSKTNQPTHFKVFNYEAGFGKSREMIRIVEESLSELENSNRYLIVKRFSRDVIEAENYLQHHNNTLKQNVLGLTKDNWGSEWKSKPDKLVEIRVIIITHQRYINLCLDGELREYFTMNRNVLIIDEKISFPTYSYSKKLYDEVRSYFDSSIQSELDKVCSKLNSKLEKFMVDKKENACIRTRVSIHPSSLANFMNMMESNHSNIKALSRVQQNKLDIMLEGLPLWYSNNNVFNNGNISTFDQRHQLWGLENNIILDASAGIDAAYNNKAIFTVVGQERLIDHINSKFSIVDFNSSKANLRLNRADFYAEICSMIKQNHGTDDKTLILCHKENAEGIELTMHRMEVNSIGVDDKYTNQEYAINWFGNLVGRNDYSDFTQCWILGTPNIPYEQYLLKYMIYNKADLGRKALDIHSGRFKNLEFRLFQIGYIAAELYQSIKRIQRNKMPDGTFFLVNNDEIIVDTVLSQIKGSDNREYIKLGFTEKRASSKLVAPDRVNQLIKYLKKIPPGRYKKGNIADTLGFSKTNFSKLLKDSRFIVLTQAGYVQVLTRELLVL